jgi:hypothetical protein
MNNEIIIIINQDSGYLQEKPEYVAGPEN